MACTAQRRQEIQELRYRSQAGRPAPRLSRVVLPACGLSPSLSLASIATRPGGRWHLTGRLARSRGRRIWLHHRDRAAESCRSGWQRGHRHVRWHTKDSEGDSPLPHSVTGGAVLLRRPLASLLHRRSLRGSHRGSPYTAALTSNSVSRTSCVASGSSFGRSAW